MERVQANGSVVQGDSSLSALRPWGPPSLHHLLARVEAVSLNADGSDDDIIETLETFDHLRDVEFVGTQLDVEAIARLTQLRNLRYYTFINVPFDDQMLMRLEKSPAVKISLYNHNVSAKAIGRFRAARPEVWLNDYPIRAIEESQ